jgi:hypothetical protein
VFKIPAIAKVTLPSKSVFPDRDDVAVFAKVTSARGIFNPVELSLTFMVTLG